MSTVRLLVLGVCRLHGRTHGYAVHRELAEWRVETWTSVRPGSIYHALKQLSAEGKLEALGDEPGERGPGRTAYRLTAAGESEFMRLLERALGSFALEELGAGVAFMGALSRERAIELLRDQHARASAASEGLVGLSPAFLDRDAPPHTLDLLELWSGSLAAMASWTAAVIARLASGAYVMADD